VSPGPERHGRLVLTVVLAIYGWVCLRTPGTYRWLDSLDLAIHETGHLVFAAADTIPGMLGGTCHHAKCGANEVIMDQRFAGTSGRHRS
jgi:hypothetical protein